MDHDLTKQVLAALEEAGARYVVFGAVALNLHGLPRATEDLDIFIAPDRDNIERVKTALRAVFADPASERVDFEGVSVPIVTPETLYRMKKGTVRPKDWGDAERIARRFGL